MNDFTKFLQSQLGIENPLPSLPSDISFPSLPNELPIPNIWPDEGVSPSQTGPSKTLEQIKRLVPDQVHNRQTFQDQKCGVAQAIDEKIDEYAAMAQALLDLSGWNGEETQDKKIEEIKQGINSTIDYIAKHFPLGDAPVRELQEQKRHKESMLASFKTQKANGPHAKSFEAYLDKEIDSLEKIIAGINVGIAQRGKRVEDAALHRAESWESFKSFFAEAYKGLMDQLTRCGLLSAVQYAQSKLAIFAIETVVLAGVGKVVLGGVTYAAKGFTILVKKADRTFRVRVNSDEIDPAIRQQLDNKDLGNHDARDIADGDSGNSKKVVRNDDEEIAAKTGATAAQISARRRVARKFYAEQNMDPDAIKGEINGIDLRYPLTLEPVGKGQKLYQYLREPDPRYTPNTGNFFTPDEGSQPTNLGIGPLGREKKPRQFVTSKNCTALKSIAAAIDDDWTVSGVMQSTVGGGRQWRFKSGCRPTMKDEGKVVSYR
ncbi:hypothetical protein PsW64_02201 [Pseudovibrio sp. W64]|uniref:polymorphic toxin type 46 domain-containing protein n=1 Tax=Pseudovibrio sp. W64 TaxID=1735583 RepID=UPI0007AE5A66|nr:polymorphic toxin type 46 domain-containing protein [Pseudovibrio sp. W64]KZK83283.1 hypothetical protein PsW64_02201 [Pseudovibrio sp. W64]